ncbi:MAG: O-antigen ligase family protein [Ilumatobacter sp.]
MGFAALAAGSRLDGPDRLLRFSRWVVVAGFILGVYSYVERWHPPIDAGADTVRLGGSYGSASFLGAALCLVLPVCVAGCTVSQGRWWRLLGAVATALGVAALIGSGTRAAWVALAVAAALAISAMSIRRTGRGSVDVTWPSGLVPAGAVVVGVLLAVPTSASVTTRTRGAGSRLADWGVGWRIVAEHPWLGVGPEGYRTSLVDGITASYERTYGRSPLPDRAHNAVIDVAAAGGLPAAALFVAIAVMVAVAGWRALRRGSRLEAGVAAGAIAYLVQQWFLFPVATIDPIFWLFAGMLVASPSVPIKSTRSNRGTRSALVAVPIAFVLIVSGVFAIAADRAARQAVDTGSLAAAQRAVELRPDVVRYLLLSADLQRHSISGFDASVADVERAVDLSPNDPIVATALADELLRTALATGRPDDVSRAVRAWSRLAADDPNCYQCQLGSGYASASAGNVEAAITAFGRAARLEPAGTTEAQDLVDELSAMSAASGTDSGG